MILNFFLRIEFISRNSEQFKKKKSEFWYINSQLLDFFLFIIIFVFLFCDVKKKTEFEIKVAINFLI